MIPALKYIGKWAALTVGIFGATLVMMKIFPPVSTQTKHIEAVIKSPIIHVKDNGQDVATKLTIVSSVADLERIKSDSAEIILLQKTIKHLSKQGSAVVINTVTQYDTTTKIIRDSAPCAFHQDITNRWITAKIKYAGKDSASLDVHVRNEYAVVFTTRKDSSIVQVRSLNPYTTTTGISAFQIPQKKRVKGRFWIGLAAGILFHFIINH